MLLLLKILCSYYCSQFFRGWSTVIVQERAWSPMGYFRVWETFDSFGNHILHFGYRHCRSVTKSDLLFCLCTTSCFLIIVTFKQKWQICRIRFCFIGRRNEQKLKTFFRIPATWTRRERRMPRRNHSAIWKPIRFWVRYKQNKLI